MTTQYRKGRHSVTDLRIHLVCIPKYREDVFDAEKLGYIEGAFMEVAKKMDFRVIEFSGEADHVHGLIEYPPKLSVSKIVNHLKGASSYRYKQKYETSHPKHFWSPSYFAVSVGGAPLDVLIRYIRSQEKPS